MIWGYTLLDEPIGWSLILGLILILSGVFITNRGGRTQKKELLAVPK